jgi:hypothetical protein
MDKIHGMTNDKLLRIYLNDHLGASMGGMELSRRALSNNEGTEFAETLRRIFDGITDERKALTEVIDTIGASTDTVKQAAAWVAEKVGRLKLNGQVTGYSPLSRLLEFEGLAVGIEAKKSLWRALARVAESDPRLDKSHLEALAAQAQRQREEMEELRLKAAELAFVDGDA